MTHGRNYQKNSDALIQKKGFSGGFGPMSRTAFLATALIAGCWGGGGGSNENTTGGVVSDPITGTVPNNTPLSGNGMIELGPVSGATVEIRTPDGQLITSTTTASDGTFAYTIPANMRGLLDQYEVLQVISRNGIDTDPTDSGNPATATTKTVNGVVQGFVPSLFIASGKAFRINPMTAFVTENIIKAGGVVTIDRLNQQARELGATDTDMNGKVEFQDLLVQPMTTPSPAKDATQSFLAILHSGDTLAQSTLLDTARLQQNLVLTDLVPGNYGNPSLRLIKSNAAVKIIYTLDGSTPEIGVGTTRDYSTDALFSFRNAGVNYREVFLTNGKYEMGEVASFHLQNDAATWAEQNQTSSSSNVSNVQKSETPVIYENGTYSIVTQYNIENNDKKYPGIIFVRISPKEGYAGENRGSIELVTYSASYEQTLRAALILTAQEEILLQKYQKKGSVPVPTPTPAPSPAIPSSTHTQNFQETIYPQTTYKGGWVQVTYQWNLDGKSDYPVKVIGGYSLPLAGRQANKELVAQNATELTTLKNQLITQMQAVIDVEIAVQPKSSYTQNQKIETANISYRGGYYHLVTLMNINGNADYPANVKGIYKAPGGSEQTTILFQANNATELTQIQAQQTAQMKAEIDKSLDDKYSAGYTETLQSNISYNGGTYTVKFQYSSNAGVDYPGMILIDYKLPNGTTSNWSLTANNENEKNLGITNGVSWVKAKIDDAALAAKHPVNDLVTSQYYYHNGDYAIKVKYNRVGTNRDFPALLWIEYHLPGSTVLYTPAPAEIISESDLQNKLPILENAIKKLIDSKATAFNTFTNAAKTQFANLTKSIQFFPSAIAAGAPVVSMRKDVPVNVGNSAYQCTGKYPITVTKVTSDNVNNILIYRSQYQFAPGVSLLAKMQFNSSISNGNACDINKMQDNNVLEYVIKSQLATLRNLKSKIMCDGWCVYPANWDAEVTTLSTKLVEYNLLADPDFKKKYDDLVQAQSQGNPNLTADIARGIKDGMIKAVKEYITGYTDLVNLSISDLVSVVKEIGKAAIDIVSKGIDIDKIASGTSRALTESYDTIKKLPEAISSLGVYEKSLFATYIGGYIGIEVIDPLKKTVGLLKGVEFPGMVMAQFLVGKMNSGEKIKDLKMMEKLRGAWSKVPKPDMSKITNSTFATEIEAWYRGGSTVGNKSIADAIRYTKRSGELVGGSDHIQKGEQNMNFIKNLLNGKFGTITDHEREVANAIYADLS